MEGQSDILAASPPRLIPSLTAGFNSVANNIQLILFPVILDILLWIGPHFSVKTLLAPYLLDSTRFLPSSGKPDAIDFAGLLDRFNLLITLRSLPVGVSSLFYWRSPIQTPLGPAMTFDVPTVSAFIIYWLLFALIGVIGASLYFKTIAHKLFPEKLSISLKQALWEFNQILWLNIGFFAIIFVLAVPTGLMILVLNNINANLAQISFLLMGLISIWLLLPLIFSPHGIFALQQNLLNSMLTSMRLVRFFLPGTGLFFLVVLLISQGLDIIWKVTPETSWLSVIGVLGHAFITTALISASFVYYNGGIRWMQAASKPQPAAGQARQASRIQK